MRAVKYGGPLIASWPRPLLPAAISSTAACRPFSVVESVLETRTVTVCRRSRTVTNKSRNRDNCANCGGLSLLSNQATQNSRRLHRDTNCQSQDEGHFKNTRCCFYDTCLHTWLRCNYKSLVPKVISCTRNSQAVNCQIYYAATYVTPPKQYLLAACAQVG